MSVYQDNGFKNRREYLEDLAEQYGIRKDVVFTLANLLSPIEDFDGLVTSLQESKIKKNIWI